MSYISLYRKYRPDTFEKVIGQEHIIRTLVNQNKGNSVTHAYLFTGTRGTGKTSTARILARSVNCLNLKNGSPCGECSSCKELARPNNFDIIELDAASNNTVDAIRDLCDKAIYTPAVVKYKVFIIDEVHMLSGSAFNALLKTLEEPPQHVVFILATTDVHKLPATILSRCLRFDFKLVGVDLLSNNIENIFDEIGILYEKEAVRLIAVAAEGSVRDSLSIADKCIAYDRNLTYDKVLEVLGASNPYQIVELIKNILNQDIGSALVNINKLASLGKNMATIAKDTANVLSNMLYIKNCKADEVNLGIPKPIFAELVPLAQQMSNAKILFVLDLLNELAGELKYTTQSRILLEAVFVRAIAEADTSSAALTQKVKDLEAKVAAITKGGIINLPETAKPAPQPMQEPAKRVMLQAEVKNSVVTVPQQKEEMQKTYKKFESFADLWKEVGLSLIKNSNYLLGNTVSSVATPENENNFIKLPISDQNTRTLFSNAANKKLISEAFFELTGEIYNIGVVDVVLTDKVEDEDVIAKLNALFGGKMKVEK
jgi:DNA polymerase-3 subunit gamma/tau